MFEQVFTCTTIKTYTFTPVYICIYMCKIYQNIQYVYISKKYTNSYVSICLFILMYIYMFIDEHRNKYT